MMTPSVAAGGALLIGLRLRGNAAGCATMVSAIFEPRIRSLSQPLFAHEWARLVQLIDSSHSSQHLPRLATTACAPIIKQVCHAATLCPKTRVASLARLKNRLQVLRVCAEVP